MRKSTFGQMLILFTIILPVMASVKTRRVLVPTRFGDFKAEIHYRKWERTFADRTQQVLEKDTSALFEYFQYVPRGVVHFSTEETPTQANGMAVALYGNRIVLNNHPPCGAGHLTYGGDWIKLLVIHELTHIIHMDQTNGFPETIRSIFGSYGKWSGVAPRWFLEGVAVWAETRFTKAGRIRNKKMRYEYDATLFRKDFCETIGCLDNPGVYPYASYPYWAGAFFMDFLEEKFPGAMRCLVRQNSYNLPGFLGEAFRDCFKVSAGLLYELFKESRRKEIASAPKAPKSLTPFKYQKDGEIYWQRGFALNGNRIFFVERDLAREHFVEVDLDSGLKMSFDFDYLIENIPMLSDYSLKKQEVPLMLYNVEIQDAMRVAKVWRARRQKFRKEVELEDRRAAHYVFQLEEESEVVLRNDKGRWRVFRDGIEIVSMLPLETLSHPILMKLAGKEVLVVRNHRKKYHLLMHSLKRGDSWQLLYSSSKPFESFGRFGNGVLIRGDRLALISLVAGKVSVTKFAPRWGDELVDLQASKGRVVALMGSRPGVVLKGKSSKFLSELNANKVSTNSYKLTPYDGVYSQAVESVEESYPSLRHFVPAGWYMQGTSGTAGYYAGFTDFNDPRGHHNFSLNAKYYYNFEKAGGGGRYTYNLAGRDRFFISGAYTKGYNWNSYLVRQRSEEAYSGQIRWVLPMGRVNNSLMVSGVRSDSEVITQVDPQLSIDYMKMSEYTVGEEISYSSLFSNSFFNSFSVVGLGTQYEPQGYKKYYGLELRSHLGLKFHRRLSLNITGVWGKLFKDSITMGYLEGGENPGGSFDIYGFENGDIFGNHISRVRGEWELNLWEVFGGIGTLPIFIQNIDLFAGLDHFKSQYLFIHDSLSRDKIWTTAHAGLRISSLVGFYLPFTLEGSVSRLMDRNQDWRATVQFSLGAYF